MKTNNFSFNSPGKINQNDTIINDSKFINLINNLSELIKTYYYNCKTNNEDLIQLLKIYETKHSFLISLINELFNNSDSINELEKFLEFKNNLEKIMSKLAVILENNKENLKSFIEKAKEIFKEMKYRRYEKINFSNINKNHLLKKKK